MNIFKTVKMITFCGKFSKILIAAAATLQIIIVLKIVLTVCKSVKAFKKPA